MKKIIFIFCVSALLVGVRGLEAISYQRSAPLEVDRFFPSLNPSPSLDLALPNEFGCCWREGDPDLYKGVFWGDPKTLAAYFQGELPLKSPIICVKWSNTFKQKGPKELEADQGVLKELNRIGRSQTQIRKFSWGNYPGVALECTSLAGTQYYIAWLGLNAPDGATLMMTFLCPHDSNCPTNKELAIWYSLLLNTKG